MSILETEVVFFHQSDAVAVFPTFEIFHCILILLSDEANGLYAGLCCTKYVPLHVKITLLCEEVLHFETGISRSLSGWQVDGITLVV